MKKRCVSLFSGGLDSLLAVQLMRDQGIEVIGITFTSPFFSPREARRAVSHFGDMPLRIVDISQELTEAVKKPRYGYGKNMNPCIDCHALMVRTAKGLLSEEKASFIITGEVLGERPKSQNRQALGLVERLSQAEGILLRPLSARLLPETLPEKEGIVDRSRLLDISGRSRKRQLALAADFGFKTFAAPAGGCLLTDAAFSEKLRDALRHGEEGINDLRLLRVGRHFRSHAGGKIVVGRNRKENKILLELCRKDDLLFEVKDFPGPIVLLRRRHDQESVMEAARFTVRYSDAAGEEMDVFFGTPGEGFRRKIRVKQGGEREDG